VLYLQTTQVYTFVVHLAWEDQMTNSTEDIFKSMGLSVDEIEKANEDIVAKGRRPDTDRRVCLCGHAIGRHTSVNGMVFCKPSRMECPCKVARPVLEVEDVRKFLRVTRGGGPLHALIQGMLQHAKAGKQAKWIADLVCDRCGKDDKNVVPVPVTKRGFATDTATGYDALLCHECREAV